MSDDPLSLLFPSERRSVCLSSPALHRAPTASRHLREGARTHVGGWVEMRACVWVEHAFRSNTMLDGATCTFRMMSC